MAESINPAVIPNGVATETTQLTQSSRFARLLKFEPSLVDELQSDDVVGGDRYHGAAADGTAITTAAWDVVRFYRDAAGNITRVRFKSGIAWSTRSNAANWP